MSTDEDTAADRKERYGGIIGAIRQNTGGPNTPLPPGIRHGSLMGNRSRAGADPRDAERALRAAHVDNDDVVRYRDPEGQWRYALNEPVRLYWIAEAHGMTCVADALGIPALADAAPTTDAVDELIRAEAESDAPDRDVVAGLNRLRMGMEAADG
jgi:hypothetical protein